MAPHRSSISVLIPIIVSISLAIGIYTGVWIGREKGNKIEWLGKRSPDSLNLSQEDPATIDRILQLIERKYVDTVERKELAADAIKKVLNELDPHSFYIPKKKEKKVNEPLEGEFEGIGVQFMIQKDTVVVVTPIAGGPSESLGIKPGDRIVQVEGESIAGIGIENKDVIDKLRGKKGTKVDITVFRPGADSLIPFTITRGKIPIHSVDVGYMVDERTGYVKITRFSKSTHSEFQKKNERLLDQGMERLILDLRGNGGGYLRSAIKVADEFLKEGKMIVYTEGKEHPTRTHKATSAGMLHGVNVAVLIDGGSASASEIVAGALQDHGRGVIVGRRSFGKGLVQKQISLPGMGAIRLTVARYHTPTGRCIQKPYGKGADYKKEVYDRYEKGELVHPDSIDLPDSLKYTTATGKVVYGGGGIMPDRFVPIDTQEVSPHYSELLYKGAVNKLAFDHADKHRDRLQSLYKNVQAYIENFEVPSSLMQRILDKGAEKGIDYKKGERARIRKELKYRVKALIGRNIWNERAYYPIVLQKDPVFKEALTALKERSKKSS
ncbi:MAG: S41 family peptidase [Flavobacteriales bacterium]